MLVTVHSICQILDNFRAQDMLHDLCHRAELKGKAQAYINLLCV